MCLDDLPLAVEGDISVVFVVAQLRQVGHQVGAHFMCIGVLKSYFNMSKSKQLSVIPSVSADLSFIHGPMG